jgi:hypothetical protein
MFRCCFVAFRLTVLNVPSPDSTATSIPKVTENPSIERREQMSSERPLAYGQSSRNWTFYCFLAVLAGFLCLAFALAKARSPWYDEGFLVNPAYSLVTTGTPGVSILDDSAPFLPFRERINMRGIRERIYLEMPVYVGALAAWIKVFGFGLVASRAFTIACGLALLLVWRSILRRVLNDDTVAFIAVALLAVDYGFLLRASEARMDTLSGALGFGGLLLYLHLRERSLSHALFWANSLISTSAFTHPNGGMLAFAGLGVLVLTYDRPRLRFQHLVIAGVPYVIGAALWGVYILQDVESFKAQFSVNARQGGRLNTFGNPFRTLKDEFLKRYLFTMGGVGYTSGLARAKLAIPIAYLTSVVGLIAIKPLRQNPRYRTLLALIVVYALVLAFTDGRRSQEYIGHIIPLYTAAIAACCVVLWRSRQLAQRILATAAPTLLAAIHLGGVAYQVKADTYRREYLPAIDFLQKNVKSSELMIGPGILGFALSYPTNLLDDFRLGVINGKTPDWIIMNSFYEGWTSDLKVVEPDAYRALRNRLVNEFHPLYKQNGFTIYRRNQQSNGSARNNREGQPEGAIR